MIKIYIRNMFKSRKFRFLKKRKIGSKYPTFSISPEEPLSSEKKEKRYSTFCYKDISKTYKFHACIIKYALGNMS